MKISNKEENNQKKEFKKTNKSRKTRLYFEKYKQELSKKELLQERTRGKRGEMQQKEYRGISLKELSVIAECCDADSSSFEENDSEKKYNKKREIKAKEKGKLKVVQNKLDKIGKEQTKMRKTLYEVDEREQGQHKN